MRTLTSLLFDRLLLATTVLLSCTPAKRDSRRVGSDSSFSVPFDLVDNRAIVAVRIDSHGPFHFILDTGARGVTVSSAVADRLGLQVTDAGEGRGVGEKTVHRGNTRIARLELGALALADIDSNVIDMSDVSQVFGTKPVDGIIGGPVFQRVVVKYDYVKRTLAITAPDTFEYVGDSAIVHFERPAQINTLQAKYGATLEGVTGFGGPVRSLLARAAELKLGNVIVRDLVVRLSIQRAASTTASSVSGLIGPDVLSQFDVTFDYSRGRMIFEKNKDYGRRDSYDRAGMWIGQNDASTYFTLIDVIAGPAAEAGIKAGDRVLAIDGASTALVLPEVRETIRRRLVGEKLTLLLESDGQQRTVVVTLRDLV
jgi:hypothetical protein